MVLEVVARMQAECLVSGPSVVLVRWSGYHCPSVPEGWFEVRVHCKMVVSVKYIDIGVCYNGSLKSDTGRGRGSET